MQEGEAIDLLEVGVVGRSGGRAASRCRSRPDLGLRVGVWAPVVGVHVPSLRHPTAGRA
jgi:hypothetical protein